MQSGLWASPTMFGACSLWDFIMSFHSFAEREGPSRAPFKTLSSALTPAPFRAVSVALHLLGAHCVSTAEHFPACLSVSLPEKQELSDPILQRKERLPPT